MTAVENVSAFLAKERNPSPISDSQVAKKSTAKPAKYLSDLNNLSQKSADSYTSSSQNSGPTFPEDDSFGDEGMNGSAEIIVNGNGSMNDEDDMLLDGDTIKDQDITADSSDLKSVGNGEKLSISDSNHLDAKLSLNNDLDTAIRSPVPSPQAQGDTADNGSAADPKECNGNKEEQENTENNSDSNYVKPGVVSDDNSNSGWSTASRESGSVQNNGRDISKTGSASETKDVNPENEFRENDSTDKLSDDASATEEENVKESELLSASKDEDPLDSDVDDSILDDPETATKAKTADLSETTEHNGDTVKMKIDENDLKSGKVKDEDDVLKTDDVVIRHDIEMTEENEEEDSISDVKTVTENDVKPKEEVTENDVKPKEEVTENDVKPKEEVTENYVKPKEELKTEDDKSQVKTSSNGVKRSLSPTETSSSAASKRSKLEEMIGRLSSTVGKKPEEVENMEEDDTESSSESEASSGSEKQITLSSKELNRIIRKRMDVILRTEKEKMQRKVDALQLNVDLWKTQVKELQKQLSELSSKAPKEKKRPSLKVQAAQHQQGLNSAAKSSPKTATASPLIRPQNNTAAQNTITVRNAQMGGIRNPNTVRAMLDHQRGAVGVVTATSAASKLIRPPAPGKPSASAKQLGGCIDLTDDDEKVPPKNTQQAAVRTLVQTTQLVSPVVQAPAGLGGSAVFLQGSPSGPLVLQPVSQGMRIAQQGNVVYASAAGSPLVRGQGVVQQFKPGQQILVQTTQRPTTTIVNRPPPPLKSAPSLQKHPAPLPPTPSSAGTYPKHPPPKPSLKISRVQQGIVLSWNMTIGKEHADITNYQLFAYQETSAAPSTNLWKKVGDVKALPLPMACTLTQFQEGNKYHFAVRAIDTHNRTGSFSDACSIHLAPSR